MNGLPKPAYILSEPHLSGHRVILGYEALTDAQNAHAMLAAAPVSPDSDLLKEAVGLLRGLVETPAADYDAAAEADQIRAFLSRVEERGHD